MKIMIGIIIINMLQLTILCARMALLSFLLVHCIPDKCDVAGSGSMTPTYSRYSAFLKYVIGISLMRNSKREMVRVWRRTAARSHSLLNKNVPKREE